MKRGQEGNERVKNYVQNEKRWRRRREELGKTDRKGKTEDGIERKQRVK